MNNNEYMNNEEYQESQESDYFYDELSYNHTEEEIGELFDGYDF